VRSLGQFIEVWILWVALVAAFFLIAVWLIPWVEERRDERVISSLLWAVFWPLVWVCYRVTGRGQNDLSGREPERGTGFRTVLEAKDYLAGQIVEEAARTGILLSDVERKMLYFSETGRTLLDIREVSLQFDREYDEGEYERKIGGLAGGLQARMRDEEKTRWESAIDRLSRRDHYLLVLVDARRFERKGVRYNLKMLVVAAGLFALVLVQELDEGSLIPGALYAGGTSARA
jgi:hypothetical protein